MSGSQPGPFTRALRYIKTPAPNPSRLIGAESVRYRAMDPFHSMLMITVIGMLLLSVGFSYRDRGAGVFMIWIGMVFVIGTVGFKILEKLT
ncbi:hypothetical protein PSCICO_34100 [Pseudomonas cichorii]|nr:hypothetical protein PSCICO_34100 [Pseudomonas cichorii]